MKLEELYTSEDPMQRLLVQRIRLIACHAILEELNVQLGYCDPQDEDMYQFLENVFNATMKAKENASKITLKHYADR